jgi:hypothetical protein
VGKRLPLATALLLIAVGLWSLLGRSVLDAQAFAAASDRAVGDVTGIEQVKAASDEVPPCCRVEP